MSRTLPRNPSGGPSSNKSDFIKKKGGNVIEISDSSDSDDYQDAYGSSQTLLPAKGPNRKIRYFGANNQVIDLEDEYKPRYLPQPRAAARPDINMNDLPPVKNEEPEINWAEWMDGEDDEEVNRILWDDYNLQAESNRPLNRSPALDQPFQQANPPQPIMETKGECINAVVAVFPEICRDHVAGLYDEVSQSSDQLIAHILDKADTGSVYPKAKDGQKGLKRKRVLNEEEEAIQKYEAAGRTVGPALYLERTLIRSILSFEFAQTPMTFIDSTLQTSRHCLFSAYRTLEEAQRTFDPANPRYPRIRNLRRMPVVYREDQVEEEIRKNVSPWKTEILKELQAARRTQKMTESRRRAQREAEAAEEENERRAQAEGTMAECGCCFGDFPLNRMVHCNSEEVLHWFCRGCARQTAENEIGNSKYELHCMSTDGCEAGFSLEQRTQFLDESTIVALERNEAEAVLRMAGIENLASCPFCPYAAEYPPVEVNREFRCQAPDCEKVSCRLCKLESHIPKSCAEHAKENGLSVRRQIEEAMSAAMIRKCNKCGTPFVKEEGCNKMTCTRNGCLNVQCYVCSKSCGYDHFNDARRGGRQGNCPLFESVEERHNNEVKRAEKEALDKVRAEHPEYSEEDLKVKMSANVAQDDAKRKARDPRNPVAAVYMPRQADLFDLRPQHMARLNIDPIQQPPHIDAGFVDPRELVHDVPPWRDGPALQRRIRGNPIEGIEQAENVERENVAIDHPPVRVRYDIPPRYPRMYPFLPRDQYNIIMPPALRVAPWNIYPPNENGPGVPDAQIPRKGGKLEDEDEVDVGIGVEFDDLDQMFEDEINYLRNLRAPRLAHAKLGDNLEQSQAARKRLNNLKSQEDEGQQREGGQVKLNAEVQPVQVRHAALPKNDAQPFMGGLFARRGNRGMGKLEDGQNGKKEVGARSATDLAIAAARARDPYEQILARAHVQAYAQLNHPKLPVMEYPEDFGRMRAMRRDPERIMRERPFVDGMARAEGAQVAEEAGQKGQERHAKAEALANVPAPKQEIKQKANNAFPDQRPMHNAELPINRARKPAFWRDQNRWHEQGSKRLRERAATQAKEQAILKEIPQPDEDEFDDEPVWDGELDVLRWVKMVG
ncbi:hypothetical protein DSL72_006180 [Monilinia vaccinii-corymbosi]|uniref:RING-type domain-containing protein n=1 Tax=Monilinia vaccinii-corymbosi TaxID=61207 RepID=A0A8A3PHZ4_9HELO|nr:hypothetical protein DSL72_006180 [Monilinia vaccinii-corymbosi]